MFYSHPKEVLMSWLARLLFPKMADRAAEHDALTRAIEDREAAYDALKAHLRRVADPQTLAAMVADAAGSSLDAEVEVSRRQAEEQARAYLERSHGGSLPRRMPTRPEPDEAATLVALLREEPELFWRGWAVAGFPSLERPQSAPVASPEPPPAVDEATREAVRTLTRCQMARHEVVHEAHARAMDIRARRLLEATIDAGGRALYWFAKTTDAATLDRVARREHGEKQLGALIDEVADREGWYQRV